MPGIRINELSKKGSSFPVSLGSNSIKVERIMLVDSREPIDIIDKLKQKGINVKVEHLASGDYVFSNLGVERKSVLGETPIYLRVNGEAKVITIREAFNLFKKGNKLEALGYSWKERKVDWFEVYDVTKHQVSKIYYLGFTTKQSTSDKGLGISSGHNVWKIERGKFLETPSDLIKEQDWIVSIKNKEKELELPSFEEFLKKRKELMKRKKAYEIEKDYFRVHSSPYWIKIPKIKEMAFFLGLWMADGSFLRNRTIITQKSSERNKVIEKELEELGLLWGKYSDYYYFRSTVITDYLRFLGLKSGSSRKEIPPFVFDNSKTFKKDFIKGLFFGDGWIVKRGGTFQIKLVSKSMKLIVGLSILLSELGVQHNTYPIRKGKYFELSINKTDAFIERIGQIPTKEISFLGKRKRHWELDYKKKEMPLGIFLRRVYWTKEAYGNFEVFDLSVREAENFLGGLQPVLLHNTLTDFWGSITAKDKRIWRQMFELKRNFERPFLVIEKFNFAYLRSPLYSKQIWGTISSIALLGINVITIVSKTGGSKDFIDFLAYLYFAADPNKKSTGKPLPAKSASPKEIYRDCLCMIPKIGPKTAKKISTRYHNFEELGKASKENLSQLCGKSRLKMLWLILHGESL